MNKIEKLYSLAESERQCDTYKNYRECPHKTRQCEDCKHFAYLPFTAEKELKLVKWFARSGHFSHQTDYLPWILDDIAGYIVFLWNRYTDTDKAEIRKILQG